MTSTNSGFGPLRRQRPEDQYCRTYGRAGFDANWRVKVAPKVRPAARPPGLSKLPDPTRTPSVASAPAIHPQVATFDEIPRPLKSAYELAVLGGFQPNAVGAALGAYRSARQKDPNSEPVAQLRKLTRQEWSTLLSLAEAGEERAYFMRSFVSKRIKLKD